MPRSKEAGGPAPGFGQGRGPVAVGAGSEEGFVEYHVYHRDGFYGNASDASWGELRKFPRCLFALGQFHAERVLWADVEC